MQLLSSKKKLITALFCTSFFSSNFAFAQNVTNKAEDKFTFSGYWRAGFNTGPTVVNRPDDVSGQGGINAPTSRHIRNPNYFRFTLSRQFENTMRVEAGIDSPDKNAMPHDNSVWKTDAVRIRDLFVELPVDSETKLWAGSKRIEYEDVRIFDFFPFGLNAFGGGADFTWGSVVLSANDTSTPLGTADENSKRKVLNAMVRGVIPVSEHSSFKPTMIITSQGRDPKHDYADPSVADPTKRTTVEERKATTDIKAGGVYSYSGDGYWANNFLVVSTETNVNSEGDNEHDLHYALYQSGSFALSDDFSILTAFSYDLWNYKSARQEYKLQNEAIVKDTGTTKNKATLSVGLQPVYFVTPRVHVALDLNAVQHFTKISDKDANATFVTPIVRYAFDKSAIGTPQIYTSVTYGAYEAKVKSKFSGNGLQKDLITTQTGFETWF